MEQNQKPVQVADAGVNSTKTSFPLLRRFSITSLVAMLITATILIFMYRQDQFAEHDEIATEENEKTAIHLTHLLDNQIASVLSTSDGMDVNSMHANPNVSLFASQLEAVREHHVLKLKIFNLSGIAVFSSIKEEIGAGSKHPERLAEALRGNMLHSLDFRKTIIAPSGELHNPYIEKTYMPLNHAGKRIGAIELDADVTPVIERIFSKTISIGLVVLGVFSALYAALFFSIFKTDRAVAKWHKDIAEEDEKLKASEQKFHALADKFIALHESDLDDMLVANNVMNHIIRSDGLRDPQIRYFQRHAQQFGGDFIAAARDNNGDLRVMLADVTGHGLQAALFLLPTFRIFYTMVRKGLPTCDIVAEINQTM